MGGSMLYTKNTKIVFFLFFFICQNHLLKGSTLHTSTAIIRYIPHAIIPYLQEDLNLYGNNSTLSLPENVLTNQINNRNQLILKNMTPYLQEGYNKYKKDIIPQILLFTLHDAFETNKQLSLLGDYLANYYKGVNYYLRNIANKDDIFLPYTIEESTLLNSINDIVSSSLPSYLTQSIMVMSLILYSGINDILDVKNFPLKDLKNMIKNGKTLEDNFHKKNNEETNEEDAKKQRTVILNIIFAVFGAYSLMKLQEQLNKTEKEQKEIGKHLKRELSELAQTKTKWISIQETCSTIIDYFLTMERLHSLIKHQKNKSSYFVIPKKNLLLNAQYKKNLYNNHFFVRGVWLKLLFNNNRFQGLNRKYNLRQQGAITPLYYRRNTGNM